MDRKFERTVGLIGEENFCKIQRKTLLFFGLGGVGGTCFEALLRTGFTHFIIVDFDEVDESNLNRQILYTEADVGTLKVEAAKRRALQINGEAEISVFNMKVDTKNIEQFKNLDFDFVIDAVDDVEAKIAIAKLAQEKDVELICSLGMANRINPSEVIITKLNKTTDDPLAKKVRYEMKKEGIDVSKINVAYSKEIPSKDGAKLNSVMFVPSAAGLNMASFVFSNLKAK